MYGDAKGNIAWWATGKLYKHNDGVETHFILDGSSGKTILLNIWISQESVGSKPKWNFVYSANNQAEAVDGFLYPGYYLPEDRAKRITQLLEPKSDWTKESVGKMLNDNTTSSYCG
jgi:penicillin amidase